MTRSAQFIALSCLAILAACAGPGATSLRALPQGIVASLPDGFTYYRLLHSFGKKGYENDDPAGANGELIDVGGILYGTTFGGGKYHEGTVFGLTTQGQVTAICALPSPGPNEPHGGVTAVNGTLFGTSYRGGKLDRGTVFKVDPKSCGFSIVHSFAGRDGIHPNATLLNVNGTLYGTAESGGLYRKWCPVTCGAVFTIDPAKQGERVAYAFGQTSGDGAAPDGALIDVNGTLYGTTSAGGAYGLGTVFALKSGKERVLYSFKGGDDGLAPVAALAFLGGKLYGTTPHGGGYSCHSQGCGVVFSVTLSGKEQIVHAFQGSSQGGKDGDTPLGGLIVAGGKLFGTTAYGGDSCLGSAGCGTAFGMTTGGVEFAVHRFTGMDPDPEGRLLSEGNALYGTLLSGGTHNQGAVFALRP